MNGYKQLDAEATKEAWRKKLQEGIDYATKAINDGLIIDDEVRSQLYRMIAYNKKQLEELEEDTNEDSKS